MAAKLTFIKKLVREEVVNTNQLIINSLFGNMLPDPMMKIKSTTKVML